jgi:ribosomal protein S18 acetylase RimI-like enzyme
MESNLEFDIRDATPDDWEIIVDYNIRLAAETENKSLDRATIEAGVKAVLNDDRKGRYFVAVSDGQIIGQLMHTWEWSDWRNGDVWWLQSVYVRTDARRQGVFRSLYRHLASLAENDPKVVGLRLYVEIENERAKRTYEELGMKDAQYQVMESLG